MRKIVQVLESISQWSGRIVCAFGLALVLLLTFEVFMRYVLGAPTIFSYEIATMIGVTIGAGGLAYTHLHHGHVRVDVMWRLLPPKGKAIADIIGSLLFFFPLTIILVYVSAEWTQYSISVGEIMTKTYLYPPAWPVRAVLTIGFFLYLLQGIARLIRDIYLAKKVELGGTSEL